MRVELAAEHAAEFDLVGLLLDGDHDHHGHSPLAWSQAANSLCFLSNLASDSRFLAAGSWPVSGLSRAAQDEAGACAERDDNHPGTGHQLLRAVKAYAGGRGHDEVEQEQEPEHVSGRE
jgi:hypothetical protein